MPYNLMKPRTKMLSIQTWQMNFVRKLFSASLTAINFLSAPSPMHVTRHFSNQSHHYVPDSRTSRYPLLVLQRNNLTQSFHTKQTCFSLDKPSKDRRQSYTLLLTTITPATKPKLWYFISSSPRRYVRDK